MAGTSSGRRLMRGSSPEGQIRSPCGQDRSIQGLSRRGPRTRVPRLGLLRLRPDPVHGSPSRGPLLNSSSGCKVSRRSRKGSRNTGKNVGADRPHADGDPLRPRSGIVCGDHVTAMNVYEHPHFEAETERSMPGRLPGKPRPGASIDETGCIPRSGAFMCEIGVVSRTYGQGIDAPVLPQGPSPFPARQA
jgi:hypothetical protein